MKILTVMILMIATTFTFLGVTAKASEVRGSNEPIYHLWKVTLRKHSPITFLSGGSVSYSLLDVQIDEVKFGKIELKEAILDFPILDGKELDDVRVGDQLVVLVEQRSSIPSLLLLKGFREKQEAKPPYFLVYSITVLRKCDSKMRGEKNEIS